MIWRTNMGIIGYDYSTNPNVLFSELGMKDIELYEVYLKIGSRESLSCFMDSSNKDAVEHNFYMGHPFPIKVLDSKFNTLYTIQVNDKYIQFMKTQKVSIPDEI